MTFLLFLVLSATARGVTIDADPSEVPACDALLSDLGGDVSRADVRAWFDAELGDPARVIARYLRHEPPGPHWLVYLQPLRLVTYVDPEFNRLLACVTTLRAAVRDVEHSPLGDVFANDPRFARASLDAVDRVLARLAGHLATRRGLEAPHLGTHVRRLRAEIARRRDGYRYR